MFFCPINTDSIEGKWVEEYIIYNNKERYRRDISLFFDFFYRKFCRKKK